MPARPLHTAFALSLALALLAPASAFSVPAPGVGPDRALPSTVRRALDIDRLRREATTATPTRGLEVLERLVDLGGGDGTIWRELSDAREVGGDLEGALEATTRAIELGALSRADGECRRADLLLPVDADAAAAALGRCLDHGTRHTGRYVRDDRWTAVLSARPELRRRLGIPDPSACLGRRAWSADLDHLVAELRRLHWVVRRAGLSAETAGLVEDLRARLSEPEPEAPVSDDFDAATIVALQRVLASIGDGHTVLYPAGQERGVLTRLPLGFWWFDDGLLVVAAEDPHRDLVGRRVVELGGLEVGELLRRLEPWVSHDNSSGYRWVAPVSLVFEEFVEAAGGTPGEIVSEDALGSRTRHRIAGKREPVDPSQLVLSLPAPPAVEPPLAWTRPGEVAWTEEVGSGVRYARLDRIDGGLATWAAGLLTGEQGTVPEHLILDLRGNAGGDARHLPPLVGALVTFERTLGGRVLVLTSRNTFSAAQTLLSEIEWLTDALVVGEPAGTRPNRPGNEALVRLPCSGAWASIASGWNQGHTSRDERVWIAPEVPVGSTSEDYLAGRDAALEVALELTRDPER